MEAESEAGAVDAVIDEILLMKCGTLPCKLIKMERVKNPPPENNRV